MANDTTLDTRGDRGPSPPGEPSEVPALVLLWCDGAPERAGEVLLPTAAHAILGRGGESGGEPRARLVRQSPGRNAFAPPLDSPVLSRAQLRLSRSGDAIHVENVGRRELLVDGVARERATLAEGDLVEVRGELLFLCVRRPKTLAPARSSPLVPPSFGEADPHGIVGESPEAWRLRDEIAVAARRGAHVLLLGETGTEKERVARALHAGSPRASKKLVARNAATMPSGLIDAELFGNVANYPNAGMRGRPGLIGEAHGGTLFLDEIGELPIDVQSHLLRVLDAGGEYQRLGDTRVRSSDLRLVAATNRAHHEMKLDLVARLRLRVTLPGLDERRCDVPLLVRHSLARIAAADDEIAARFFDAGRPRVSLALVGALVRHRYRTHVRELEALLRRALATSAGSVVELTPAVERELVAIAPPRAAAPDEVSKDALVAALARAGFVKERACQLRAWRRRLRTMRGHRRRSPRRLAR